MTSQNSKNFETPRKASLFEEKFPQLKGKIEEVNMSGQVNKTPSVRARDIENYCFSKSWVIKQIKEKKEKLCILSLVQIPEWNEKAPCNICRNCKEFDELLERLKK